MRKSSKGFTLIELLIVIAIILIIAAIAIPNLLRSRIAANQASAVGSLRTYNTSEVTYATTYNTGFAPNLTYMGPQATGIVPNVTAAGLLDNVLAPSGDVDSASKSGYNFVYSPGTADSAGHINNYSFWADPIVPGTTGTNYYYTDESGVIRQNSTTQATASDSPLAG
jgi:prepilin-type N-terminal cleavage/methylation domain-containing protein